MYEVAHINLKVKDIQKSSTFYREVLECELLKEFEIGNMKFQFLKIGNQVIELTQHLEQSAEPPAAGVIDHFAIKVNDMDKEFKRLKQLGVNMLFEEPREVTEGMKIFFFAGPDGEKIEFIQE